MKPLFLLIIVFVSIAAVLFLKQADENERLPLTENSVYAISLEPEESGYQLNQPEDVSTGVVIFSLLTVTVLATALTFGGLKYLFSSITV
ncbi:hypothetical protein [Neolewinella agarilytica]|uniref:Uncharacterized protein n=1 Tax=Neolewinella agarilytica TaxID=478744 RepID=A0A1H9DM86_9BACT|nr:hypothetical protein [Neolewinella agarilytica]SEQ14594.1 hypothetical protein SAMN05444359_10659 [Neolewinella agarilytica]